MLQSKQDKSVAMLFYSFQREREHDAIIFRIFDQIENNPKQWKQICDNSDPYARMYFCGIAHVKTVCALLGRC